MWLDKNCGNIIQAFDVNGFRRDDFMISWNNIFFDLVNLVYFCWTKPSPECCVFTVSSLDTKSSLTLYSQRHDEVGWEDNVVSISDLFQLLKSCGVDELSLYEPGQEFDYELDKEPRFKDIVINLISKCQSIVNYPIM